MGNRLLAACVAVRLLATTLPAAEPIPHHQDKPPGPALSPEDAIARMTVPEGFIVELVAAEPDVVNPVAMTIDERGRFWICESLEYPRRSPGVGKDRVKILEDTDGDGRVDKTTIFADGLNIPSGIAVGYGGVWVANAPDILFLQDTDGDGKADTREVVVTGFGRHDTHELPNSLTWGPDGWLYGLNGVFNASHVKYPEGSPHAAKTPEGFEFTVAMFRIHPRTREFQVFAEGTSNPWGIAFDNEGSAFVSACVIDHLWHIVETGYYHRQAGAYPPHTWKIESIVKHKHQKAAYCGIHYVDTDAYPKEYSRRLFLGNIHGNCINVDEIRRAGSTYFGTPNDDFLSANDAWFMPVVQKTGPDGSLYVLDWYDRYHCYQDANRDPAGIDRLRGRLYRVRYKDTPRVPQGFDLAKKTDDELIALLDGPNDFVRSTAQRLLAERNTTGIVEKLSAVAFAETTPRRQQRHALFALMGCDLLQHKQEWNIPEKLAASKDPVLRAWALRCLGLHYLRSPGRTEDHELKLFDRIVSGLEDDAPEVRLQAVILSRHSSILEATRLDFGLALGSCLERSSDDPLLPRIIWRNLLPQIKGSGLKAAAFWTAPGVLKSSGGHQVLPRLTAWLLDQTPGEAASAVEIVCALATREEGHVPTAVECLALVSDRVQNRTLAGDELAALRERLQSGGFDILLHNEQDERIRRQAAFLATSLKDSRGITIVRGLLTNAKAPEGERLQALSALVATNDDEVLASVDRILGEPKQNGVEFRGKVLGALGQLNHPRVADIVLAHYQTLEPELQPRAIELLTQRAGWAKALLAAVGARKVPANALNVNQVRKLLAIGDAELAEQVRAKWGTIRDEWNPQREQMIAEMRQLVRSKEGNPFAGEKVFNRVCGQCHKIYGEGQEVGPDITLNGRNSFEQLLSNVFDPSLVIGAAYRAQTVVTTDGRVLTGLVAEDNDQRIVLKVQGGKLETIAREDVEVSKASEISMMPEGLEKQLKPEEIVDLFAFITLDRPPGDPNARRLPGAQEVTPRKSADPKEFTAILAEVAPGFTTGASGEGGLALLKEHQGRAAVETHPVNRGTACVLRGTFEIPSGKKSQLVLSVGHHRQGDWQLVVKVDGRTLLETLIGPKTTTNGWADHTLDLTPFAGKRVDIELHNHPNNWAWEFGYWGRAAVVTE